MKTNDSYYRKLFENECNATSSGGWLQHEGHLAWTLSEDGSSLACLLSHHRFLAHETGFPCAKRWEYLGGKLGPRSKAHFELLRCHCPEVEVCTSQSCPPASLPEQAELMPCSCCCQRGWQQSEGHCGKKLCSRLVPNNWVGKLSYLPSSRIS